MKINKTDAKGIVQTLRGLFSFNPTTSPTEGQEPVKGKFEGVLLQYNVQDAAPVFVAATDPNNPTIAQGNNVYADAAGTTPYPDGTYTVAGTQFSFTVQAGVITLVVDAIGAGPGMPVQPAAQTAPAAQQQQPAGVNPPVNPVQQAAPAQPHFATQLPESFEAFKAKFSAASEPLKPEEAYTELITLAGKFATGTTEERITGLETMVSALMQYAFGWDIQRINQQEAINTYNSTIGDLKAEAQQLQAKVDKYKEAGEKTLELFEQFLELPAQQEPKTLTDKQKENFERQYKVETRMETIAKNIRINKNKTQAV